MNDDALHNLNRVLGLQLAAVQQHFIHVLMLGAWNEDAVADRITSIDAVDLPNAMRIVDYVVSTGHLPGLASDRRTLAANMPRPGGSVDAVCAAELQLDCRLGDVLTSVERELRPRAGHVPLELVSIPLESRTDYQDWLRQRLEHPGDGVKPRELAEPARSGLDALFANLMVTINQTLVHAFVHWHGGEPDLADNAWEMSGAAMMHATGIVNSLALRHVAPDPRRAVMQGTVALPCVAAAPPDALASDHLLAERCRAAAQQAAIAQEDAELAATCGRVKIYYDELVCWRPGRKLPRIDNPCVDFGRVLREYALSGSTGSASSTQTTARVARNVPG